MLEAVIDTCVSGLCGCTPCEAWLWAVLAFFVYETCELGG